MIAHTIKPAPRSRRQDRGEAAQVLDHPSVQRPLRDDVVGAPGPPDCGPSERELLVTLSVLASIVPRLAFVPRKRRAEVVASANTAAGLLLRALDPA